MSNSNLTSGDRSDVFTADLKDERDTMCGGALALPITGVFMLGLLLEEVVADAALVALFFVALLFDRRDTQLGR